MDRRIWLGLSGGEEFHQGGGRSRFGSRERGAGHPGVERPRGARGKSREAAGTLRGVGGVRSGAGAGLPSDRRLPPAGFLTEPCCARLSWHRLFERQVLDFQSVGRSGRYKAH